MNEHVKNLIRIVLAGLILFMASCIHAEGYAKLILFLVPFFIAGYDVLIDALRNIFSKDREIFDEKFLMSIASVGALCLGEYVEASAVMILYQAGELFQDYASERSRENIIALMDLRPEYANVERNNILERVKPDDVHEGSIIVVRAGERIPIDGIIVEGHSNIDTSALTGESIPKNISEGDKIMSGCINLSAMLRIKTTCEFKDSSVSKILALIENANERKSHTERFITRFAKVYTPVVCISALALAIIPSLINPSEFTTWLYRALTFLVISCPCALVISVPLAFFSAVGGAGRAGILVKGSNFIEALAKTSCVLFDKTGTLTRGVFEVVAVHPEVIAENELLHLAAHVERYSTHPAAEALRRAYPKENDECIIESSEEIAGYGVKAKVNGDVVCVGSSKFMDMLNVKWHPCTKLSGTIIHVAINNNYAGHVVISDIVKPNAKSAIDSLKSQGINRIIMLTGDTKESAEEAASSIGINEVYSSLLPADKVAKVDEVIREGECAVFVGDGINDAPVIARADVGVAMGALGSDAAIESADVVLMDDDPMKISNAISISRKAMKIAKENIIFSVGVKVLCLAMGALGYADMWLAVFSDVGVMILAVMNSVRPMFAYKKDRAV